jgi:hypothetical protein
VPFYEIIKLEYTFKNIAVMKLKDFYNAEKTVWLKIFSL